MAAVVIPNRLSDQAICGNKAIARCPPLKSLSSCRNASAASPAAIASVICQTVLPCHPATTSRTRGSSIFPPTSTYNASFAISVSSMPISSPNISTKASAAAGASCVLWRSATNEVRNFRRDAAVMPSFASVALVQATSKCDLSTAL